MLRAGMPLPLQDTKCGILGRKQVIVVVGALGVPYGIRKWGWETPMGHRQRGCLRRPSWHLTGGVVIY